MSKYDYIMDGNFGAGVTENEINKLISEKISGGNMILIFTDKFVCSEQEEISDTAHLLEARIFTDSAELKIMRPTIADSFSWRLIDDEKNPYQDIMDEKHYLSINEKKTEGKTYYAIGGGSYTLPIENAERILIRNYISYDDRNIASFTDFRVVKYLAKGE